MSTAQDTFQDKVDKKSIEKKVEKDVEKDLKDVDNFSFNDVLIVFSIVGITIGTAVGFGLNEVLASLSENILDPIISIFMGTGAVKNILSPSFGGVTLHVDKFLTQIITFALTIGIIYLILKYAMNPIVRDTIKFQRYSWTRQNKQNIEIIKNLEDLNKDIKRSHYHW